MRVAHAQLRCARHAFALKVSHQKCPPVLGITTLEDGEEEVREADQGRDTHHDVDQPALPGKIGDT